MSSALVIRFVPFENLDGFAATFLQAKLTVRTLDAWHPQAIERAEAADVLVVMGGPVGVDDLDEYPYLGDLILMLRDRLAAGAPTLGICLGAQLMAQAMGASVQPGEGAEIGIHPISLTADGHSSALECFADEPLTWHWHQDVFDLPPGAVCLARSAATQVQAFAVGSNILACQFHPEFAGDVEPWLVGHAAELRDHGVDVGALRDSVEPFAAEFKAKAARVARRWLEGLSL